ncbi:MULTISPECIES: FliI/YscN family ATPase [Paraburkholderia]|uniref:FliI/YscN family ATPase n=1 Tax=Paraburkholderia TaxID=1822464 RepID=UPI00225A74BD|nr:MULTISPECIES: FliI/YscN family ATPase [Paraburkholderia]MCX4161463.1 FliI/YscN family ATPase [Paraburkholderia megapolitana]MDN7156959.1 FliI/YscN family ATPase [Paraburkholderia sp. CHISQ3]MDQ6494004.1 FliI/YscN family ATPase [Paraburkholderia megapolitana]
MSSADDLAGRLERFAGEFGQLAESFDSDAAQRALADELEHGVDVFNPVRMRGRVSHAVGLLVNASGLHAKLGEICELRTPGELSMLAEVVGFARQTTLLTPLGATSGLSPSTEVIPSGRGHRFAVGNALRSRVLNGLGAPLDERGEVPGAVFVPAHNEPINPLRRRTIDTSLATGVRVIDTLLTVGVGQRIGVFAPSGVGKSTLLGMIARGTPCDVIVIGLVGERGREVREFIEHNLSPEAREKTVIVASTSDRPAMERVKSAHVATAIAEYFRDQGLSVLLLIDSLTRFARAQREVGLASGEPPTRRSFPPSTFSVLPQLLERAGQGERGSITAFYTVLVEGDEETDPIAEEVRSIVDGHIVLSRKVASANRYPAIDVLASLSRVMSQVVASPHRAAAAQVRSLLSRYQDIELLVQIGEYRAGADPLADAALAAKPELDTFFTQPSHALEPFDASVNALIELARRHGLDHHANA